MNARSVVKFNDGGVIRYVDPDRPAMPFKRLDFQTGDLTQWDGKHVQRPEQIQIVQAPAHPRATHVARFELAPDDYWTPGYGTIRGELHSQVNANRGFAVGKTQWYGWSTYLPEDFSWPGGWKEFFLYMQLHITAPAGSPAVSFRVTPGAPPRLNLQTRGGSLNTTTGEAQYVQDHDAGELPRGEWIDHLFKITWGDSPGTGLVSLWLNGEPRLVEVPCANIYTGYTPYLKHGIYASATTSQTHVLYHTGMATGQYMSDVLLKG